MRLTDLDPHFTGAGGEGVTDRDGNTAPERTGVGLMFDCPCGECGELCHVRFLNPIDGGPPIEGGAGWTRTGDTYETLTLTPSILRNPEHGGCGWHGFITNGEVTAC